MDRKIKILEGVKTIIDDGYQRLSVLFFELRFALGTEKKKIYLCNIFPKNKLCITPLKLYDFVYRIGGILI